MRKADTPLAGKNGREGAEYYRNIGKKKKTRVQLCFRVNSQIAATESFYVSWFAGGVKDLHQV